MEEDRRNNLNPEPYYYQNVLLRLSIKSGNAASIDELRELTHLIGGYDIDGVFDRRRGSLTKIRDVFVSGKEMGQLLDVTHCKADEEIYESVIKQKRTPVPVSAHFEEYNPRKSVFSRVPRNLHSSSFPSRTMKSCSGWCQRWCQLQEKSHEMTDFVGLTTQETHL